MLRPCLYPGCPALTSRTRCPDHERQLARHHEQRRNRPSTAERGYGTEWQKASRRVIVRDDATCYWCGGPADTTDHLLPKVRGGSDDESNLVAACRRCNSVRGGRERGA